MCLAGRQCTRSVRGQLHRNMSQEDLQHMAISHQSSNDECTRRHHFITPRGPEQNEQPKSKRKGHAAQTMTSAAYRAGSQKAQERQKKTQEDNGNKEQCPAWMHAWQPHRACTATAPRCLSDYRLRTACKCSTQR